MNHSTLMLLRDAPQDPPMLAKLGQWTTTPFKDVPLTMRRCVYGVPYVEFADSRGGGRLWVTRHGWGHLRHLDPADWYDQGHYARRGKRLSEGTGAVYRVPSASSTIGRPFEMVVKFSRMAQGLPVHVSSRFPSGVPRSVVDSAVFNDPFQEFGLVERLRHSGIGPAELRIRTKRPLAIYSPGKEFAPWQLGRNEDRFRRHVRQLEEDQRQLPPGVSPLNMSISEQYVYLFHWARGHDAQHLVERGEISAAEAAALVVGVIQDLAVKGFRMLDIKPGHIILRRRHDGSLLRRRGKLVYALVDFELLQRADRTNHGI